MQCAILADLACSQVRQPWLRTLIAAFGRWPGLPIHRGDIGRRVERHMGFLRRLDLRFQSAAALSQAALVAAFGAETLRRHALAVRFLIETCGIPWQAATLEDAVELGRIARLRENWSNWDSAAGLNRYADDLANRTLKTRTIRLYLTAAAGLVRLAKVSDLGGLAQQHVDRYLHRHRGQAASLSAFARHLHERYGIKLRPRKIVRLTPRTKERRLVARIRRLLRAFRVEQNARRRAIFAAALVARLYSVPLSRLLAMQGRDIRCHGDRIILWPDGLTLEPELALAQALTAGRQLSPLDLVFPGRNGAQPMTTEAVRYHEQCLRRSTTRRSIP